MWPEDKKSKTEHPTNAINHQQPLTVTTLTSPPVGSNNPLSDCMASPCMLEATREKQKTKTLPVWKAPCQEWTTGTMKIKPTQKDQVEHTLHTCIPKEDSQMTIFNLLPACLAMYIWVPMCCNSCTGYIQLYSKLYAVTDLVHPVSPIQSGHQSAWSLRN